MGKKDKNPTPDTAATEGAAEGADGTPTATEGADTGHITYTMDEFLALPDRADWLSVAEAGKRIDIAAQTMRNAANNRKEFKPSNARLYVQVPGYAMKPLTYLHVSAIDAYKADKDAPAPTRGGRVSEKGKRWVIHVKPDMLDSVKAALAPFNIEVENVANRKPKGTTASTNGTTDAGAPTPIEAAIAAATTTDDVPSNDVPSGDPAPGTDGGNVLDGAVDQWRHNEDEVQV